jgi:hypothetical protein
LKKALFLGSAAVLGGVLSTSAGAQDATGALIVAVPPTCAFSENPIVYMSMRAAPMVAVEFQRQGVRIADAGEPYNASDVVGPDYPPERQFVRAYQFGERWIIWYIRGGFGETLHIREMREFSDQSGGPMQLRMTHRALGGDPCRATQALLDGVVSAHGY